MNIINFWPNYFIPNSHSTRFNYAGVNGLPAWSSVFSYDSNTDSMLLNQYDVNNVWLNTWYLKNELGMVVEWRDDIAASGIYKTLGVKKMQEVYSQPIIWGSQATLNTASPFVWSCALPLTGSWPPQAPMKGIQAIQWEAFLPTFTLSNGTTYANVLVQVYQQSWNGGSFTGARQWLAQGIGPIANQWLAPNPNNPTEFITELRQDATIVVF